MGASKTMNGVVPGWQRLNDVTRQTIGAALVLSAVAVASKQLLDYRESSGHYRVASGTLCNNPNLKDGESVTVPATPETLRSTTFTVGPRTEDGRATFTLRGTDKPKTAWRCPRADLK